MVFCGLRRQPDWYKGSNWYTDLSGRIPQKQLITTGYNTAPTAFGAVGGFRLCTAEQVNHCNYTQRQLFFNWHGSTFCFPSRHRRDYRWWCYIIRGADHHLMCVSYTLQHLGGCGAELLASRQSTTDVIVLRRNCKEKLPLNWGWTI